jgi:uncharacterized membrane protein YfcA
MIEHAKNMSLFLIIGLIVALLAGWLQSDFISGFLSENLITLLIALVAINTTTLSVVLTKIRELSDKLGGNFTRTAKEMKISIKEQVVLVILAVIVQVIGTSSLIIASFPPITFVSNVVLIAIFSYALYILYDTANSVFVILQFENDNSKDKDKNEQQKPIKK